MGLVQLHGSRPRESAGPPTPPGPDGIAIAPAAMSASELMYFHGAPLAHVVSYEEHLRATRCERIVRVVSRGRRALDSHVRAVALPSPALASGAVDGL